MTETVSDTLIFNVVWKNNAVGSTGLQRFLACGKYEKNSEQPEDTPLDAWAVSGNLRIDRWSKNQ